MIHALRLAFHQLRRQPRFALLTVLVMGLAIAAATTVFTVVDSVVLQPLPYSEPDRLVALWDYNTEKGLSQEPMSPVNFMDHRELDVFADAAAWWRPAVNLVDPGMEPTRVETIETSANLFEVLGVRPQVGIGFPEDGPFHSSDQSVAVISDRLWRTRYGADTGIVGKPLMFNGAAYEIVGVMPAGFHFPDEVDVWQRLRWDLTQHSRYAHFMEGVARLAPDVTLAAAQAATDGLAARLGTDHADSNAGWSMRLVPLLHDQLGYYRPALLVLFGAVGLLLVIGVLNVSTLLYTRSLAREREIAVRVSMGASPFQLLRQLLAEALVLAAGGAAVGLAVAAIALPLLGRFVTTEVPR
ncbi:MAG: ABC transporter permease, partial [Thermoanaerobaculia bacterium]|nr:ABC transporter permease [Thermoanaerobaculia bacterium]